MNDHNNQIPLPEDVEEDTLIEYCLYKGYITLQEIHESSDEEYRDMCESLREKHIADILREW